MITRRTKAIDTTLWLDRSVFEAAINRAHLDFPGATVVDDYEPEHSLGKRCVGVRVHLFNQIGQFVFELGLILAKLPSDAEIYRSLLHNAGIHREGLQGAILYFPGVKFHSDVKL